MPVVVLTDSYADENELTAYATARGITIAGDESQLLIQAMDWLEQQPFASAKVDSAQILKWPRDAISAWDEYPLDDNDIPLNIKQAQMVAALVYDGGGNPIGAIARAVKREKVDVLEVEYADNAASQTLYPLLSSLIAPFLGANGGGTSFAVTRG